MLTVEELLKSLFFLGKKEILPAVSSPRKQWVSWIIRKELPKESALKKQLLAEESDLPTGTKEFFSTKFQLVTHKHENCSVHNIFCGDSVVSVSMRWNSQVRASENEYLLWENPGECLFGNRWTTSKSHYKKRKAKQAHQVNNSFADHIVGKNEVMWDTFHLTWITNVITIGWWIFFLFMHNISVIWTDEGVLHIKTSQSCTVIFMGFFSGEVSVVLAFIYISV